MTAKRGCIFRAGGSTSEGDTGTTGNMKWTKPGKLQRLAKCRRRGDIAESFYCWWCKECSAVKARHRQRIPTLEIEDTRFSTNFPSIFFRILQNNRILIWPRIHGTYCIHKLFNFFQMFVIIPLYCDVELQSEFVCTERDRTRWSGPNPCVQRATRCPLLHGFRCLRKNNNTLYESQ
jgi:hypothetical protein